MLNGSGHLPVLVARLYPESIIECHSKIIYIIQNYLLER